MLSLSNMETLHSVSCFYSSVREALRGCHCSEEDKEKQRYYFLQVCTHSYGAGRLSAAVVSTMGWIGKLRDYDTLIHRQRPQRVWRKVGQEEIGMFLI